MINYIAGLLLLLVFTFGYISYSAHTTIGELTVELREANQQVKAKDDALLQAGKSCVAGQTVTASVSTSINKIKDGMTKQLEGLAAISATTLPGETKDVSNKATAPQRAADDARLSGELERLLDQAYCANTNDSACPTR